MFQKENALIDRFTRGLTLFAEQLQLKNLIRYLDDNITAEQFVCRLMNVLYDNGYRSDNGENGLTPGYDLISEKKNEVIQISRTADIGKIKDAADKLKKAIGEGKLEAKRYTLRFAFLVNDASRLKTTAAARDAKNDPDFAFDPDTDILDFRCFAARVKTEFQFVPEKANKLRQFMDYCHDIFPPDGVSAPVPAGNVEQIIDEYARNFDEPLFMHQYSYSPVTLRQMYVDPAFRYGQTLTRDMVGYFQTHLNIAAYNRERIFFIEGSAAIGKTSFVSWLCWHYRNQTETAQRILNGQKLVCVRLRELEFGENRNAVQVLLHKLDLPDAAAFETRYSGALMVLDGADELSMVSGIPHGNVEEFLLALQRQFRYHKFLITTRPQFLEMERFKSGTFLCRKIELVHYDETMRAEWLDRYLSCGQTIPENTERFIRELKGREENGIADTPLALYLLAQCDADTDLLGNPWALYRQIFSKAIVTGEYNTGFDDLMDARSREVNYRVVQAIAFRIFRNAREERYYLNEPEILEAIGECALHDLTPERVRETCVLCAYWKNTGTVGALEFYHNNIRDFFLCEYLCGKLLECLREPDPVEALVPMLCRVLCHADICESTWKQMYQYLCLRLDYESVKDRTADSLYHLLQEKEDCLCRILPRVTAGRELWNNGNDPFVYRGAKATFRNIYMLVRILSTFCSGQIDLIYYLWDDASQTVMDFIHDWDTILYTPAIMYMDNTGNPCCIDATSRTNYHGLDLSCTFKDGLDFNTCHINVFSLDDARFCHVRFIDTTIQNLSFHGGTVQHGRFDRSAILDAKMYNTSMYDTFFKRVELAGITGSLQLTKCKILADTTLQNCYLKEGSFVKVDISETQVINSHFYSSNFNNVTLTKSKFADTYMSSNNFRGKISNVTFENCKFSYEKFIYQDTFQNVTFRKCCFKNTSFRGKDLSTVTFENCKFEDCDPPSSAP